MPDPQTVGGALGRMLGRRVASDRLTVAALSAARTTCRTFLRILHVLFLEITGFIFFCLAVIGFAAFRREYGFYKAGQIGPGKAIVAACFLFLFLWFALSNFWKSRKTK